MSRSEEQRYSTTTEIYQHDELTAVAEGPRIARAVGVKIGVCHYASLIGAGRGRYQRR